MSPALRPTALLLACLAMAGCGFVDSARRHLDLTGGAARLAEVTSFDALHGQFGEFVAAATERANATRRTAARLGAHTTVWTTAAERQAATLASIVDFEPLLRDVRAAQQAFRAFPERMRLLARMPSDATDRVRDVTAERPAPSSRRSLFGRITDRIWR